ncbi:MAG: hypothetical protein GX175_04650 [Halanaerobiaceae bacterium]|nr:hypothetical protein [Halanaerobiaceae bacterium]
MTNMSLTELNIRELTEINGGGIGLGAAILITVATAVVCYGADHYLKEKTGKDIGEHGADLISSGLQAVGGALQKAGQYLQGK